MIELKYPGMKTKNIIYTGPIFDYYNGELHRIFCDFDIQQQKNRVLGKDDSCKRPMIIINLETKTAWIEYVDEECSQYDSFYNKFTCDIQEVERMIEESQESKE